MKNIVLSLVLVLAASAVEAQTIASAVDMTAVKAYAAKLLPRCPGATVTFDPVSGKGPAGFHTYRTVVKSTDQHCGTAKHILYSPLTDQTLFGSVIVIPSGLEPVHVRLSEHTSRLLNADITANISPMKLADGLKQVSLVKETEYGPFAYTGYLDESERYFIVGLRGNLKEEPAATLRKELGVDKAASRGNGAARIEVVEISDFQCPTCARAHTDLEPLFEDNLGKIRYSRIDLPLFETHDWSLKAALGARAVQRVAPGKYWSYVDTIFENQQALSAAEFDAFFENWATDSDVNWLAVSKIYKSTSEQKALLDSVSRLFAVGVSSTPTYIVNGQLLGYGSGTFIEEFLKELLVK